MYPGLTIIWLTTISCVKINLKYRGHRRMTRGGCGSISLQCMQISSTTFCRFQSALLNLGHSNIGIVENNEIQVSCKNP